MKRSASFRPQTLPALAAHGCGFRSVAGARRLLFCAVALGLLGACGNDPGDEGPEVLPEPDNHRPMAISCDRERPFTPIELGEFPSEGRCTTHEECTAGINGRCSLGRGSYYCSYDRCFEDSDCGSNVCACNRIYEADTNVCVHGNCQVDADCGEGGWCSPNFLDCGSYRVLTAYWCRTPEDTCLRNSDCVDPDRVVPDGGPGYCMFSQTVGRWECSYSQCAG